MYNAEYERAGTARRAGLHAVAACAPPAEPASDIAIGDWDDLLGAVTDRLRRIVGDAQVQEAPADRVVVGVLDCAAALEQLQAALTHELSRRRALQLTVLEAQAALARARADLVGTQAGERRVHHIALHDALTALPNRGFFHERLGQALARSAPQRPALAVLHLDLDGFKPINDAHGHETGDALLRIVAARLTRAVRGEDMVARLGSDEFGCLLADLISREQLGRMACKLFDAVSAPLKIGALQFTVRPSIGIAVCPRTRRHGRGAAAQRRRRDVRCQAPPDRLRVLRLLNG